MVQPDQEPEFKIDDEQERYPFNVKSGSDIVGVILLHENVWMFEPKHFKESMEGAIFHRIFNQDELTQILAKVKQLNESKDG